MISIKFLRSDERKKILQSLKEQYGIEELPFMLIETGKEKIRAFSGSMTKDEILKLGKLANIELIGLYMIKQEHDLRLSFDATHLLKNQITKSTIEIDDEQLDKWMHGNDIEPKEKTEKQTYVISHKGDFLGGGKSNGQIMFNYVPKDRRLK
ncbi:MAG: hypothetical protein PHH00_04405 [Candidatus Nanoarchaeia archaeon]|nr:hypothetical protein [Candidatus Nanoarchaeia archaeon]